MKTYPKFIEELVIKYKDEDGIIQSVSMAEIIENIGFEYGLPENVIGLIKEPKFISIEIEGILIA